MSFHVGPYRFTATDAARTFGNVDPWWTELTRDVDARSVAAIGERIARQVELLGGHDTAALQTRTADEVEAALGAVLNGLAEAAAILRSEGRLATTGSGHVAGLHSSKGGVPKTAVDHVTVGFAGVQGDVQKTRVHHGRPWQALCLWSAEVIAAFAADGHPVVPGGAGENVTIAGLPWALVRPGVRIRIGDVLCEASLYALPCRNTAFNFRDGEFELMHHERGPVSRMYATVLEPGEVRLGAAVALEA